VGTYERPFYDAMLVLFALAVVTLWFVRGSKLGLALLAIRDDEDRARGLGVQTSLAKLAAFSLSAGLVGMVGAVWAYYLTFVYPQFAVDPLVTIGMVLMVYLGGRGTVWGPALGAFILVPAQQYLAYRYGASQFYLVGYAAVFLVVMLLLPRGILPSLADVQRRVRARGGRAAGRRASDDVPQAAA
jgi:branched-chain amino acid transport system permease protein